MRCLLVYAHADDELLWGHPWLLDRTLERRVLICCSDRTNPLRQSYRRGEEALAAVCGDIGVSEFKVLSQYHSEFYKLRTRGKGDGPLLREWWSDAQSAIREMSEGCDFIATHNPIGEYGHMDHILVRRAVLEMGVGIPVKWTDARVETSTWPVGSVRTVPGIAVEQNPVEFARLKNHYVSRDCWTWSSDEPLNVNTCEARA